MRCSRTLKLAVAVPLTALAMVVARPVAAQPVFPDDLPLFLGEKLSLISMIAADDYDAGDFAAWAAGFWVQFDRNGDGVTPDEVAYRMLVVPAQEDRAGWERYHKQSAELLLSMYLQAFKLDPNQDGVVAGDEIAEMARGVFAFADEDRDGLYSTAEGHHLHAANRDARYKHCTLSRCTWE